MNTTFSVIVTVALGLFFAGCSNDGRVRERPKDIDPTGPKDEIYQKIVEQFPEHRNVQEDLPALFEASARKEVVLTSEAPVYVTFIAEGASLPNSFGWYSYHKDSKPTSSSSLNLNILFPHVSDRVLNQGDRLRLGEGTFPPGTVIGFFLIIHGWQNGVINYDRETFYTDLNYNPGAVQQHVLFKQGELGDIVLAFEDVLTTTNSDRDFNDIIFTVSDNNEEKEVASFQLEGVPHL